jgi:hypothetical protein
MSTPAIGDVDGDGLPEVAWGSLDARVYLVRGADGVDKPGWPRYVRDTIFSSPVLADFDGDGKLEVIIGVDAHLEGPPFNTPDGGCLHVFRYAGGEVAGFPKCIDQVIGSPPAVGDIDGDGKPEIVFGTGLFWPGRAHKLYALRCDGTAVPGWPVSVDGQVLTAPALADLDGDGIPEVIATDYTGTSAPDHVYAFKGNGTLLWKTQPKDFFGSTLSAGHPVVADILGNGDPEIIVPTNGELCVLTKAGVQLTDDGSHLPGSFSFATPMAISSAAVTDMESDGVAIEVVALSSSPFPSGTDTQVHVWTPKPPSDPPWGMFRQNPSRQGVVPGTPSCGNRAMTFYTLAPCRAVDTRNSTGPFGGPALSAQIARAFSLAGQCGIPAQAGAASLNVTIADQTTGGSLTFFPGTGPPPPASTVLFPTGRNRANNIVVGLNGGIVSVQDNQASGTVNLIIDVNGYFK